MCGIAGWVGGRIAAEAAESRLARMCDTIVHRGPDDRGTFNAPGVALGMQRLSIVDLAGGRQPMHSADGEIQLVFNGEIYNHGRLRDEMRAAGISFATHSDTEVILRLYEERGLDGFGKLNGMFAIAIWDGRRGELHLVRDRMGVKPLYWRFENGELLFASEIKAILAAIERTPSVDERAVWDYLTFRYVPGPQTIWHGLQKLPPGHRLTIGRDAAMPRVERYWDIPRPPSGRPRSDAELQAEFDALLIDSTALRMEADVPVGVLLSGGLDSSAVAAAASEAGHRLTTYSVAFADSPEIDERPYARAVAAHLGCDHHEVVIGPAEFIATLPELVRLTDEPLADLASVPLYHVCKLARRDVKVVVSGEGSDEILGGYAFDAWAERWDRERRERASIGGRSRRLLAKLKGGDFGIPLDLRKAPYPLVMTNYMSSAEKRALLRQQGDWPDSLDGPRAQLDRFGPADPLAQVLYAYCQDWLVEDLLMKADRMSMAVSLELRTPFLDYRLVELAARLPSRLRVGRDTGGKYRTKLILRRFAERRLPAAIIDRPKQGFPVPVYAWLSNRLRDWAHDCLSGAEARLWEWCEKPALARIVGAGTAPDAPTEDRHRLWNILILELWIRQWL